MKKRDHILFIKREREENMRRILVASNFSNNTLLLGIDRKNAIDYLILFPLQKLGSQKQE
jgi:hypothetical protein